MSPDLHEAEPIPEAARAAIDDLLRSGDLFRYTAPGNAPVTLLEREFAEMIGARYALAVSSCSAALFLALTALDLPPGARVTIPAFTFAAVPSAVLHAGATPVLCEVGSDFRLDLADFEAKLADAHAVLVSHMRGHTSDMDAITALCAERGLPLIEDAAHSLGTRWAGRNIGTLGRAGCFSFQSYKMINAGEGGILVTDDADLVARAVILSGAYEHNWKKHDGLRAAFARWQNRLPLYNLRMGNLPAAIIRAQLPELAGRVARGRAGHARVAAALAGSPFIEIPHALPPEERAPDSLQFTLAGLSEERALAFTRAAARRGVPVQIFGLAPDNARAFWNWEFLGPAPDLPRTRAMLMRACDLRLPVRLTGPELDAIAAALLAALDDVAPQEALAT